VGSAHQSKKGRERGRARAGWAEELGRAEGEETGRAKGHSEGERGSAGPQVRNMERERFSFFFSFFLSFIPKAISSPFLKSVLKYF